MAQVLEMKKPQEAAPTYDDLLYLLYASWSYIRDDSKSPRRRGVMLGELEKALEGTPHDPKAA